MSLLRVLTLSALCVAVVVTTFALDGMASGLLTVGGMLCALSLGDNLAGNAKGVGK